MSEARRSSGLPVDWAASQTASCGHCRLPRHARPQPPDDVETGSRFAARTHRANVTEHRQRRPVVVGCDGQSAKSLGHHTHDLEREPIHDQAATENGRVAREQPVPSAVTENHDWFSREGLVVARRQRAPHRGAHAEDPEEVARDERAPHHPSVNTAVDLRHLRVGVCEDAGLAAERVELRAREMLALAVGAWPFHGEHLVHIRHRIHAKHQRVEHRERHGNQAESERHG